MFFFLIKLLFLVISIVTLVIQSKDVIVNTNIIMTGVRKCSPIQLCWWWAAFSLSHLHALLYKKVKYNFLNRWRQSITCGNIFRSFCRPQMFQNVRLLLGIQEPANHGKKLKCRGFLQEVRFSLKEIYCVKSTQILFRLLSYWLLFAVKNAISQSPKIPLFCLGKANVAQTQNSARISQP